MKIDFLYFNGCPNSAPTLQRLFDVLSQEDVTAEVNEIEIVTESDAKRYRFLGSPSIRIDGSDIEAAARSRGDFGLMCRTYPGRSGIPSLDMIDRAVLEHAARADAEPRTEV